MRLVSSTRATAKRVHHLADVENWHLLASMQDVMYWFNPLYIPAIATIGTHIAICCTVYVRICGVR